MPDVNVRGVPDHLGKPGGVVKLYQLVTFPPDGVVGPGIRLRSKRVFANPFAAHDYAGEFEVVCRKRFDDFDLSYSEHVAGVGVLELELHRG